MQTRAALVTGGGSGIGKALAGALVGEGYAVTISGRDERKLAAAAEELGGTVVPCAVDLADEAAIGAVVEAHRERHGRLDVLVNAAGDGGGAGAVAELPTERIDRQLNVNLRSCFLIIRAAMPMLTAAGAEHGKALVVNVASMAAKGGTPGMAAYAAAKAGVIAMTESAQAEVRDKGIQFTVFTPGFTNTPMATWTADAGVAPGEMVQPDDLGEGLRFLLRTSPSCHVREIEFVPPTQGSIIQRIVAWRAGAG